MWLRRGRSALAGAAEARSVRRRERGISNLENSDFLSLIAEVSAAFVGFSMVVGVLRPDQPDASSRMQSMRAVAETALIAGGGAVLPLLLMSFGLREPIVWRISGLLVAASWITAFLYAMRRFSAAGEGPQWSLRFAISGGLVPLANLLLLWNVVAPTGAADARHASALVAALAISAERFVATAFDLRRGGPAA